MARSLRPAALALSSIYASRTFTSSTVSSMLLASILESGPHGGVSEESLRGLVSTTTEKMFDTYPDREGGLLRVSVLQQRDDVVHSKDPRMTRRWMGINLASLPDHLDEFLKGIEGVWVMSDANADLAVGAHLIASFRGYVHPAAVRKVTGWSRVEDWTNVGGNDLGVWFHTSEPDPEIAAWIGSGIIVPPDGRPGPWGWAVLPER